MKKMMLAGLLLAMSSIAMADSAQDVLKKARDDYYKQQEAAKAPKKAEKKVKAEKTKAAEVVQVEEETVEEEKEIKEGIEETESERKSDKRNTSTKININTASAKELESLKGIGPATAKNIISYREEYGGFSTIEEIMNVKRIGEKTFAKIQDFITVE